MMNKKIQILVSCMLAFVLCFSVVSYACAAPACTHQDGGLLVQRKEYGPWEMLRSWTQYEDGDHGLAHYRYYVEERDVTTKYICTVNDSHEQIISTTTEERTYKIFFGY